jgi:hypothetical protein
MDQPLDLSLSNNEMIKKKKFTIEYLTSNIPNQSRSSFFPCLTHANSPLNPVENRLNNNNQIFGLNEHVVPTVCSPPLPVSLQKPRFYLLKKCFC